MNDLTEIALNALEREESADATNDATDTTNDGADEKDTSNAGDGDEKETDDDGETESEQNTDENNDGDDSDEGETEDDDKKDEDDSEEKSESDDKKETKKKSDEMTDEEFEELAKKRGYSKKSDDDDKKRAEEEQKRRNEAINSIPKPKELDADTWASMPPINKVIYSRLPYITAHGKDGDVKIKTPEQLPDDFEFANDKARARAIISEIGDLQKTGDLPTPTAAQGTPEFDNDPAVKTINKVLNYQAQRARQGVQLSVRDALVLYRAEHPNEFKEPEDVKAKGDDERKKVAKKVAGNTKSTNKSAAEDTDANGRKYYRPGMSTQDVLDRALQDLD